MAFPVDVLTAVSHSELEQRAQSYMRELLYRNPESLEQLTLPDTTKVDISISSVGLVPLYGSCDTQKVLALFTPAEPFTPVALYLLDQWWPVEDILHTADTSRDGLLQVDTLGERIVLYVLNRIVYRVQEMSSEELPFLCHGEQDFAKILWKNGEAVGFYSVKPTGSPCSSFSSRTYPLPVMDSVFVRKCQRGKGLGLRMLEDYVDCFQEDYLGLKYPLTTAMYKVCQCYLRTFHGDSELLWEVDSSRLSQRTSIASRIQSMSLKGVSKTLTYSAESAVSSSVHHTEERVEEIIIVKASKGTGPVEQKNTDEQCSTQLQMSEEETLFRLMQNTDVVQTEELLEVTTENGTDILITKLEDDTVFDKVTSLLKSDEESLTLESEKVTQNLNTLCSPVITIENVAAEVEECLHSQEQCVEKSCHQTVPPEGTMQRVLRTRTVVNIPQPTNEAEVDGDMDKQVNVSEITKELKHGEDVATEDTEETQVLHRMPLRGRHSDVTTPKPTRVSMRLSQVKGSIVGAHTPDKGPGQNGEINAVKDTEVKEGLVIDVTNETETQEEIIIVTEKHTAHQQTQDKRQEKTQDEKDSEEEQTSDIPSEDLQIKHPKEPIAEVSDAAAVSEEAQSVTSNKQKRISSTQGEAGVNEVVDRRSLRSGARPNSSVQKKLEEKITVKLGKKSTARKQVSRSKAATQELEASSAEEDTTNQMPDLVEVAEDEVEAVKDSESQGLTGNHDSVSKEANKDQDIEGDTLQKDDEKVKGEIDITGEATALVESSVEALEEEIRVEASAAELECTIEVEDTEQTESNIEMDKETKPEAVIELNIEAAGLNKEPEQEPVPEQSDETSAIVETRSLRSGPKTVTATPRRSHTAGNQSPQPESPEKLQKEPQNEQDSIEEQSKECAAPEIPSEAMDNDKVQSQTKVTTEIPLLAPSQTEDPEKAPEEDVEEVSDPAVVTEAEKLKSTTDRKTLSSSEIEDLVERRSLRSGARSTSSVPMPRTTRSSKLKIEEQIVEKTTIKRGKKSTGRKQVSRSKTRTQELEASSAEEDPTQEAQVDAPEQTTTDNNDTSTPTEGEEGVGKDQPNENVETAVSKEGSEAQKDTLDKDIEEEVKGETDMMEEETAVVQGSTAETGEEEKYEEASAAEVECVLLSPTEAEDTEQTESTMEIDKATQPEAAIKLDMEESGLDKEPEQESVPEQSDETAPIVETRSLKSGPKTITATPRCSHTAGSQSTQPESPERSQEKTQNEQDSTEELSKKCVVPEIFPEAVDNDDAQSDTQVAAEVPQLVPSQTKDTEDTPEKTSEECVGEVCDSAVITKEAPSKSTTEHKTLTSGETEEVVERRSLRSGARATSSVSTPRTTRSSKLKVEEQIVEKTTLKRGKKSTGSKRVSRSKAQTQELEASSAEENTTEEAQVETSGQTTMENNGMPTPTEGEEEVGKDQPNQNVETTVSKEVSGDKKDALDKDIEEVNVEADVTEEEAAVVESSTFEEKKREKAAEVDCVLLRTTEAEDKEQIESTTEIEKETQPEDVPTPKAIRSCKRKIEEQSAEKITIKRGKKSTGRKRVSRSKTKTQELEVSSAEEDSPDPIPDLPAEGDEDVNEPVKDSESLVIKETQDSAIKEDSKDKEHALVEEDTLRKDDEAVIMEEQSALVESSSAETEEQLEKVCDPAVVTDKATSKSTSEHKTLSSSETEEVVERRSLRSGIRSTSSLPTPRTTRSKLKIEGHTVDKVSLKTGKKSTGRKRESRSKAQTKELEASSAEEDTTEEAQVETPGQTTMENNGRSTPTEGEEGVDEHKPNENLDTTVSKEVSKDLKNALDKDIEEVNSQTDVTEKKTAVVESSTAEAVEEEKRKEAVEVDCVLLNSTEAENTEQNESTIEMEKESQPADAPTPRAIKSSKRKIEEQTVEKTTIKRGKKSTGRKRVRRSKSKPQELEASSAEEDTPDPIPDLPTEGGEDVNEPVKDSESPMITEKVCDSAVVTEEATPKSTTEHKTLSSSETEEVAEKRSLRSGARSTRSVPTPRLTRSNKLKIEEQTVDKVTITRGKKLTGRKRESRSKAQTQDLEASSAEEATTEEAQVETPQQTTMKNNDTSTPTEGEEGVDKDKSNEDLETAVSKEASEYQKDTLDKDIEEVNVEADVIEEEAPVEESSTTEVVEEAKRDEASAAELDCVPLSPTEAEDTEQTECTMEIDKETQPEISPSQRTTRSGKHFIEEQTVVKATIKRGKKSTGRKRFCRSKTQIQELEASFAEVDTSGAMPDLPIEVGKDVDTPVQDSESPVVTETQGIVSNEDSIGQEPALVEEDTWHKDDDTNIMEEETPLVERSSVKATEEKKDEESAAEVECVHLSSTENTEKTENTKETDKETLSCTAGSQSTQPESPESSQEEPQNEQDSIEEQSKECAAPEIPSEEVDNDEVQSETKMTAEIPLLAPSQTKDPEEEPEENVEEVSDPAVVTEADPLKSTTDLKILSSSEIEDLVERRSLRSGARSTSSVTTPRTTRSSKLKLEEQTAEKPSIKRGKKSTRRKRVSRSKAETQELEASSAEEDPTQEAQVETPRQTTMENNDTTTPTEGEEGFGKDQPNQDVETTISKKGSEAQKNTLDKDIEEEVKGESNITQEEIVVIQCSAAEAGEEKSEEASTAEVDCVLCTTVAEDTEQSESIMEMDKEPQPDATSTSRTTRSSKRKVQTFEKTTIKRGMKSTERKRVSRSKAQTQELEASSAEEDSTDQMPDLLAEGGEDVNKPVKDLESPVVTETQNSASNEDNKDQEHALVEDTSHKDVETDIMEEETVVVGRSSAEAAEEINEEASAAEMECVLLSTTKAEDTEQTKSTMEVDKGTQPDVSPRATRSSKQKIEVQTAGKTTIKRGKKSTGRNRVSRSKPKTQELEASSPEENTPDLIPDLQADISKNVDELIKDSESLLITEMQDNVSKEDSKDQEPAHVEEYTLHIDGEEVKGETDITEEETAVVESSTAEDLEEEKRQEASAAVECVLSTTETENTQQTESTMEMDKQTQPEAGLNKHPEQESALEQSAETAPVVETRSLRSGPMTITAAPRCSHTAGSQSEIPSEALDDDDAQSETKISTEVSLFDLPRVAVVLVDVQKLQVFKSTNEMLEQQGDTEEREGEEGYQDAMETNKQEQAEEAEGNDDHTEIMENADSSPNASEGPMPEKASLLSEEDSDIPVTPPKRTRQSVPCKSQTRRSSRKRPRVDYCDTDDFPLMSKEISKGYENDAEPQSEEESSSEGIVLSLCLDEEEEEEEWSANEEPIVITAKNLRSRSVPSIVISPHSKATPVRSPVISQKRSPERSPQHKRRSATTSPRYVSKCPRK